MTWRPPESGDMTDDVSGFTQPIPLLPGAARPVSRGRRFAKRLAFTVATVIALVVIAAAGLLLLTPSATEATKLAQALASARHIGYPGPPVPANFSRALIATEDHRFYSEPGIDPFAVGRVVKGKITGGQDQGGATIEQQLAKMLYTPGQSSITAELKQVAIGVKLNFAYSKSEILQLYAEAAYYGHGYYGLEAASCGYFGRPAAGLTVVQGAMLAGVVNAPSADDPIDHPGNARARLQHVIGRMAAVGDLTPDQAAAALRSPLGIVPRADAGC